jgi:3-deoxy-D-manno-octulosonic-acid transferase
MLKLFYSCLSTLLFPFVFFGAVASKKLRIGLFDRLMGGSWNDIPEGPSIWIHAASLGELQGVLPLLKGIKERFSERIVITTTSVTGLEKARSLPEVSAAALLPYDHPIFISQLLRRIRPSLVLLFETEIWPNMLLGLKASKAPVILVNGRISDRTFPMYRRLRALLSPLLQVISVALVQTNEDGRRFKELGVKNFRISGNTKYDIPVSDQDEQAKTLRQELGVPDYVQLLICGSVRPGESEIFLESFNQLRYHFPDLRLVIVPRHPERFEAEYSLMTATGLRVSRRTAPQADAELYLMDSLGELRMAYAASEVSFVGGTLVNIGGHNPLEPAALQKPILLGPYTQNVRDLAEELLEAGGAILVIDSEDICAAVRKLLSDPSAYSQVAQAAYQVALQHRGAIGTVLAYIDQIVARREEMHALR